MTEKRSYTAVLASVETHIVYINNHLSNIDKHLEKLNTEEAKQNIAIAKNKERIGLIFRLGGALIAILGLITAIALGVINLF